MLTLKNKTMQKHTPKVSVIVPAYNEESYIVKTLDALRRQNYPNVEVIVVNNASTDRTAERVAHFIYIHHLHFRFRLLHEKRRGTQYARECGRRAANGAVIAQLDADCLPPANWISDGVRLLQAKPGLAAVAGPYDYFDSQPAVRLVARLSQRYLLPSLNTLAQWLGRGGVLLGGNVFIPADVLERCGGYNTALRFYGDDVDIALRVSKWGKILFTPALTVASSSRRYKAAGFFQVQAKYTSAFLRSLFAGGISRHESVEWVHPR